MQKTQNSKTDINYANNNGFTPLLTATYVMHLEGMKLLIKKGADINHANNDGFTPLIRATVDKNLEGMKLLSKAVMYNHLKSMKLFPEDGSIPDIDNQENFLYDLNENMNYSQLPIDEII